MIKMTSVTDILKIWIHPDCEVLPDRLKGEYRVIYDEGMNKDEIAMGQDAAFLVFTNITLPKTAAELVQRLYAFIDSWQSSICVLQHFPEILDQRQSKLMETFFYMAFENGVSIIPTRTVNDTALCIRSWAKRIQVRDMPPKIARVKGKQKTVWDAQQSLIEGLVNCGPAKAEMLMGKFTTPAELFTQIQEATIEYTRSGRVKGVNGKMGEIEGIGPEFVIQNGELLQKKWA
jgi:hypothetical protein